MGDVLRSISHGALTAVGAIASEVVLNKEGEEVNSM